MRAMIALLAMEAHRELRQDANSETHESGEVRLVAMPASERDLRQYLPPYPAI